MFNHLAPIPPLVSLMPGFLLPSPYPYGYFSLLYVGEYVSKTIFLYPAPVLFLAPYLFVSGPQRGTHILQLSPPYSTIPYFIPGVSGSLLNVRTLFNHLNSSIWDSGLSVPISYSQCLSRWVGSVCLGDIMHIDLLVVYLTLLGLQYKELSYFHV